MEYLIEGYNKEIGNVFPSDIFPIAPCSCFTIRCEELGVGPVCAGVHIVGDRYAVL